MPSIADLFISVSSDVSGAISGLTDVDTKVNGTTAAMQAAAPAGLALAAAAGAVGAGFLSSISVAQDFEHQINGINSVMSPDDVNTYGKAVEDLALKLGKDTTFSASQAADAIQEMIKAGVPLPAILGGAAQSALDLASATGTNVTLAAGLASTAMNTYHLSAEALPGIMDTISNVSNSTATSVEGLHFALAAVGPVAAGVGLNFTDTATALGIFANNGLQGSDAGTSLKTMLLNLEPSTKSQIAAFQQLGLLTVDYDGATAKLTETLQGSAAGQAALAKAGADGTVTIDELFSAVKALNPEVLNGSTSAFAYAGQLGGVSNAFFDANGQAKSMRDIFEILRTSTSNLTDEQKINMLQTAFGTDAVRAATIAAHEGAAGWDAVTASMDAQGGTAVAAATRNAGLTGAMNQLNGSVETIQINIGKMFLPLLTAMVTGLTTVLNAFLSLDPSVQGAIVAIVGVSGAIAGAAAAFVLLGPVISSVVGAFGILLPILAGVSLPVLAIAAAAAVLYEAWQTDFGGIREVTEQVWAAIQPAFVNIQNFIAAIGSTLGPAFRGASDGAAPLLQILSNLAGGVLSLLPDLVRSLGDAFNFVSGVIQGAISIVQQFTPGIELLGQAFTALMQGDLGGFFDNLGAALQSFGATIDRLAGQLWDGLVRAFQNLPSILQPIWNAALDQIGNFFQALPGWIATHIPEFWQALVDRFGQLATFLQPAWDRWLATLAGWLGGLEQFVLDHMPDLWLAMRQEWAVLPDQLALVWKAVAPAISGLITQLPGVLGSAANNMWQYVLGTFSSLPGLVQPVWNTILNNLGGLMSQLPGSLATAANNMWQYVLGAFSALPGLAQPLWSTILENLGGLMSQLPGSLATAAGNIWQYVLGTFSSLAGLAQPIWNTILSNLGGLMQQLPGVLATAAGNIWQYVLGTFSSLAGLAQPIWNTILDNLGGLMSQLPGALATAAGDIWSGITGAFGGLIAVLTPYWQTFTEWFRSLLQGIPQFVIDNVGDVFGGIVQAATDLAGRIATAIDPIRTLLANTFGNIGGWITSGTTTVPTSTGSGGGGTGGFGGGDGTIPTGTGGPLVYVANVNASSIDDVTVFLNLVAQAVLASSQRVTPPTGGANPALA